VSIAIDCPICGEHFERSYGNNGLRGHLMREHRRNGDEAVDLVFWLLDLKNGSSRSNK